MSRGQGMGTTMTDTVRAVRSDASILIVEINRPEARNAINGDVVDALSSIVEDAEQDDDVRVVILTGAGDQAFCAGADLKALAAGEQHRLRTQIGGFAGFVNYNRRKPWIAAVNGPALAGGCEIALACDIVIASERASFGLPEVKRGLVAGAGGIYRLMRTVPRSSAMELILSGERVSAAEAKAVGLVSRVVPGEALMEETLLVARAIAVNAPLAVYESLAIARLAFDRTDAELSALSLAANHRVMRTEDFKEGTAAFIEKRAPRWRGR